jgi:hypothetical protein
MLLHDFWGISFVENHLRQIAHFLGLKFQNTSVTDKFIKIK